MVLTRKFSEGSCSLVFPYLGVLGICGYFSTVVGRGNIPTYGGCLYQLLIPTAPPSSLVFLKDLPPNTHVYIYTTYYILYIYNIIYIYSL